MKTEKKVGSELGQKVTGIKKSQAKVKKPIPLKFDKEGFFLSGGIGVVCTGIGFLIIWATKTAPEIASKSTGFTTSQRLARLLPESTKETLAFIIGSMFVLFGIFCIFLCLKLIFKYIIVRTRSH